ncbi:MAG: LssY C-terminal domain-containing protein [Elusimicrobia bacterium]|nr:LssY C-terminal domain-containing protein [Elusimicrobiota bacterium]
MTIALKALYASLPTRNVGRWGRAGDPLNLLFKGTEPAVCRALESAGWTRVPNSIAGSCLAGLKELWQGRKLTRFPPMNAYRVLGRVQDMNWAQTVRPLEERHHFRLWKTELSDSERRPLWWGSGNYDLSIRWIDLSHRPDPDMDFERDHIARTLRGSPWVRELELVSLPQVPRAGSNDKGHAFRNDGRVLIVDLL